MKPRPLVLSAIFLGSQLCSGPIMAAAVPTLFYDSQRARANDFSGAKSLAAIGFTDVHGAIAAFAGGNLILTPDSTNGGTDAFARDYVLRAAKPEQVRDLGCRVVLPANYRTGSATLGLCLRFAPSGTGLLLNFAPESAAALSVSSMDNGVATQRGSGSLSTPYVAADPVAVEARVIGDAAVALTVTDLTTSQIIGFLNIPLNFGGIPAGDFGLVPWTTSAGGGHIVIARVQTYPVTAVVCDGDSLTVGENDSAGKGTASPLGAAYPCVLQKTLGNRYHVFNLGRSGLTLTHMNSDAAQRVDALLAPVERPPIIVLEGGTNDFGIDGSIKPPMSISQAAETVYARLQTYWAARHAARADATVIDLTNTPADHPVYAANLGSHTGFNQRRDALNNLREKNATGARPDFIVDDSTDSKIGRDGCEQSARYFAAQDKTHLTDAGYAVKAALVAAVIQQAGSGRQLPAGARP